MITNWVNNSVGLFVMFFPGWSCLEFSVHGVNILGNSMILCGIWHKYHSKLLYKPLGEWNWRQFWNITSGIYAKYQVQIMLLFAYTTTLKRFVIFTFRYFKLSWNTTALIQSNCRNFSCSRIIVETEDILGCLDCCWNDYTRCGKLQMVWWINKHKHSTSMFLFFVLSFVL